MRKSIFLPLFALGCLSANAAYSAVIFATNFSELSNAINTANANSGSTIYLAPGTYGDGTSSLPFILASVTISLDPAANAQAGSAILNTLVTGQKGLLTVPDGLSSINLTVDGLTFQNAQIDPGAGGNGAGIRYQGSGAATLSISNSIFRNNQDGILTGDPNALVQNQLLAINISNSVFENNGGADGLEHAIYAFGQSLSVSNSTFCGTIGGHDIKSRTAVTTVTNSTLFDGQQGAGCATAGSSSYALDAPNGGQVSINGVTFSQGAASPNHAIVSYGEEGLLFSTNSFSVNNSIFTSTVQGTGIQELDNGRPSCLVPVQISNTSFSANLVPVSPPNCASVVETPVPVDEPHTLWIFMVALFGTALIAAKSRGASLVAALPRFNRSC